MNLAIFGRVQVWGFADYTKDKYRQKEDNYLRKSKRCFGTRKQ